MGYMLSPEYGDLLMEEYMRDTEDPQTNRPQFLEMMKDNTIMTPALQTAHFQYEYICNEARLPWELLRAVLPDELCSVQTNTCLSQSLSARHLTVIMSVNPYD
jgi:hypothetical protein